MAGKFAAEVSSRENRHGINPGHVACPGNRFQPTMSTNGILIGGLEHEFYFSIYWE